jgi:hypothetical protein
MTSSGLSGPWEMTAAKIDAVVTKTSAGAYALGYTRDGTFYIKRVGRSDKDLNARLKSYIGDYKQFKCDYFSSPKAAFEKECGLYHDFNPDDNVVHPDRPNGSNWSCPRCRLFD